MSAYHPRTDSDDHQNTLSLLMDDEQTRKGKLKPYIAMPKLLQHPLDVSHYTRDIDYLAKDFTRKPSNAKKPNYNYAIHEWAGDRGHIHIIYKCCTGNAKRTRERILADLPDTATRDTKANITNTKIKHQQNFMLSPPERSYTIADGVPSALACIRDLAGCYGCSHTLHPVCE